MKDTDTFQATYTCTVCGRTKTESIPKLEETTELLVPSVTLSLSQNNRKIRLTGTVTGYEDKDAYYEVTGFGFLYILESKLGDASLTVDTAGRTKVTVCSMSSDGIYTYNMAPKTSSTMYVIRAWVSYTDSSGNTAYAYSDPICISRDSLID